jgi:methylamine dehydrogenase heavy chain
MTKIVGIGVTMLCVLTATPGWSLDAQFQPQHLTVKPAIESGANVFTMDQEWGGASSIHVFSAADLTYKGALSTGTMAQMLLSTDGKTAYTVSVYMKRIAYGEAEMVLQAFDVATLSPIKEVALPPKFAMLTSNQHVLAQSADGKYLYVQNATPATSVTVVDVVAGKVKGEIPTPGCFGIYPSVQGSKFSVICGDGTFASYALTTDGATANRTQSKKIFDVDEDPLFLAAQRAGADLIFISYHGNVYRLSDRDAAVRLLETFSVTAGIKGGWAPGGYELIAYNRRNDVLFIGMHPDANDGSHKQGAKEIWAYSLADRKLLYRSPVEDVLALTVSDDAVPELFAIKEQAVMRFEVDPEAKFALKKISQALNPGQYNLEVVLRP